MTEMFGEAWSPMSVPDLAPDDDDDDDDWAVTINESSNTLRFFRPRAKKKKT